MNHGNGGLLGCRWVRLSFGREFFECQYMVIANGYRCRQVSLTYFGNR
jgi:hypothetical protein